MVLVLGPFGISITNCFSRNYTGVWLPLQPPVKAEVGGAAGRRPGEVVRRPSETTRHTATLWGAAVDQAARARKGAAHIPQPPVCPRVTRFLPAAPRF